jgi:hypothetical protein
VVVKWRTDRIVWLGGVLWDVFATHRVVEGKPAEMRTSVRCNGRSKEHVEADVMDMECGVLSVARGPVTDRATVYCGENSALK